MVVIDTNVIIDHLRQSADRLTALRELTEKLPEEEFTISVISIQELYEGQSTKDEERLKKLLRTTSPFRILPYTEEIAKFAGVIARDLPSKIDLADAAIAATAILNKAKLATLDKKDFLEIKDLQFAL